jgi:hypothetical protein
VERGAGIKGRVEKGVCKGHSSLGRELGAYPSDGNSASHYRSLVDHYYARPKHLCVNCVP